MKKLIKFVLCVMMLVLIVVPTAVAADSKVQPVYNSVAGVNYYYTDEYFNASATSYNPSLATMSLIMTINSFGAGAANHASTAANAKALFKELGYTEMHNNEDYNSRPLRDTLGVVCAQKTVEFTAGEETTIIVVGVRSSNYGSEWASNYTLGVSGFYQGMNEAATKVINYVNDYVSQYAQGKNIKLWMSGFSRGGGATNIAAANFSDKYGKENVFAYTFGAPNTANIDTVSKEVGASYTNIFNLINPCDFVTIMPPASWGFFRFGVDIEVCPANENKYNESSYELAKTFLSTYGWDLYKGINTYQSKALNITAKSLASICLWNTNWKLPSKKIIEAALIKNDDVPYNIYIRNLVDALVDIVDTREVYVNEYQHLMRIYYSEINGWELESECLSKFWGIIATNIKENFGSLSAAIIIKDSIKLNTLFTNIVKESLTEAGLDSKDYTTISKSLLTLIPVATTGIIDAVASGYADTIATALYNIDQLTYSHLPEYNIAWVMAQDPNYTDKYELVTNTIKNAEVTAVNVKVNAKTTKVGIFKIKKTVYDVVIETTSNAAVQSVSYKCNTLGTSGTGKSFTLDSKLKCLTIEVIDANGEKTKWQYNGLTTIKK